MYFGCCCLFLRLLYRNLGRINPDDIESVLRQPDCVVAGAAADLYRLARTESAASHSINEIEVGLADVPRNAALFVRLTKWSSTDIILLLRGRRRRLYMRGPSASP